MVTGQIDTCITDKTDKTAECFLFPVQPEQILADPLHVLDTWLQLHSQKLLHLWLHLLHVARSKVAVRSLEFPLGHVAEASSVRKKRKTAFRIVDRTYDTTEKLTDS